MSLIFKAEQTIISYISSTKGKDTKTRKCEKKANYWKKERGKNKEIFFTNIHEDKFVSVVELASN